MPANSFALIHWVGSRKSLSVGASFMLEAPYTTRDYRCRVYYASLAGYLGAALVKGPGVLVEPTFPLDAG